MRNINKSDNPVFILSMPRAGSTLLSLLLGNHPDIVCPPEPWIQLSLAELIPLRYGLQVPIDEDTAAVATGEFLRGIAADPHGSSELSAALRLLFKQIDIAAVRKFGIAVYDRALAMSGKRVFVDKTPRYYHILDFLDEAYPAAKKIFLKRNPLDIAASYKSTWNISIEELVGNPATANTVDFAKGLFDLERYAQNKGSDVEVVAYEDLVSSPEETLERICKFLAIRYDPEMLRFHENSALLTFHKQSHVGDRKVLNAGRQLDTFSVGRWRSQLSDEEVARLISFLGRDIFLRLGYDHALSTSGVPQRENLEHEADERRAGVIAQLSASTQHHSTLDRWAYLVTSCGVGNNDIKAFLQSLISTLGKNGSLEDGFGQVVMGLALRYKRSEDDRRKRFDTIGELTKALVSASEERSKHLVAIDELTIALKRITSEQNEIAQQPRSQDDRAAAERAACSADLARMNRLQNAISIELQRVDAERAMYASEARELAEALRHAQPVHMAYSQNVELFNTVLEGANQENLEITRINKTLFDILERRSVRLILKILGIVVPARSHIKPISTKTEV